MNLKDDNVEREPLIEASYLTMSYSDRDGKPTVTLKDIQLKIFAGEFVCLLGPSGSGKTTLLKLFGGFLAPSEGGVLFKGQELSASTPQIGMIFQEPNLFSWLTVEQNIAFGPRMAGRPKTQIRDEIEQLLRTVGLYDARAYYPHQLSGGMRQRTAIARALATQPNALLLDEPFSALDVVLRRRMQDFIREIWERKKTTMIMVTHSIEEALLCAQRVIVLGGHPSRVLEDIDVSKPALKDRYSPEFVSAQRRLEELIDAGKPLPAEPMQVEPKTARQLLLAGKGL
jgi:ABC-type nitrate/sulfonate/bicarbonate transport system ATPase subunit